MNVSCLSFMLERMFKRLKVVLLKSKMWCCHRRNSRFSCQEDSWTDIFLIFSSSSFTLHLQLCKVNATVIASLLSWNVCLMWLHKSSQTISCLVLWLMTQTAHKSQSPLSIESNIERRNIIPCTWHENWWIHRITGVVTRVFLPSWQDIHKETAYILLFSQHNKKQHSHSVMLLFQRRCFRCHFFLPHTKSSTSHLK